MNRRVVITGLGVVSPIGCGKENFMDSLIAGKNGISQICVEGLENCYCKLYGMLDQNEIDRLAKKYLSVEERSLSRCSQLSLITAIMAVNDAKLSIDTDEEKFRTGVMFGTTQSDQYALCDNDKELECNRFSALANTAKHFDIHGESFFNANLCASGNHAISYAEDIIKSGRLDTAIVGGADVFSKITYVSFNRLKAFSPDAIRPFDQKRNGTVLSEGAAMIVLEEYEHAKKRGAHIYGEIIGSGMSNDAYNIVAPDPSGNGIISAMKKAVDKSGISADDVDFVALHGTGTSANDSAEASAITEFFGNYSHDITATAIKGNLGHQLGAASVTSMVMCALIPQYGCIPPTINVSEPEQLKFTLVTNSPLAAQPQIFMNNAYAFGGSNCSVLMKRWNDNE